MSVARLQTILEHVEDAVFVKDAEGRYLLINPAGARMLGRDPADVIGRTDRELFGESAVDDMAIIDREVLASGQAYTYERRRRLGGAERVLFTTKVPYFDTDGGPAVIGISRDITEQRRLERQLGVSDRLASIGAIAGGVAHEVNNPLTYIIGGLDIIADEVDRWHAALGRLRDLLGERLGSADAEALLRVAGVDDIAELGALRDRAREAREGSQRVRDIVYELGQLARPRDDASKIVDINRLLDSILAVAASEVRYRARVVREYGAVPLMRAREAKLRQLFLRLLLNAVEGLESGSAATHEIHIRTRAERGHVVVEIIDTAGGIDPEVIGLHGIAALQELVAAHAGQIEIEGGGGRGTRAVVELPLDREPTGTTGRPAAARDRAEALSILIVDDEPLVAQTLQRMLGRQHAYALAASGKEAQERFAAGERFDAVLSDVMMPRVTGIELFRWLQEHAPDQAKRFAFITGGAFTGDAAAFLADSPRPVLEKPFTVTGARALLARLLEWG